MGIRKRGLTALAAALILALLPASGLAQPAGDDATARARSLFEEGTRFADQRRWEEAAERFRAALDLRQAAGIRYNLASALFELGSTTEAHEEVSLVLADRDASTEVLRAAETLRDQILDQSGMLVIETEGEAVEHFALDGWRIPAERIGRPIPVSPGRHTVEAIRAGDAVASQDVEVARGAQATVRVVVASIAPADVAAAAGTVTEPPPIVDEDDGPGIASDWRFWTALGTGVALVAVVVVLTVALRGSRDQSALRGDFSPRVIRFP